jgi:hypothetical protein
MYEEMLDDQEDDGRIVSEMEQANKKPSLKQAMMIICDDATRCKAKSVMLYGQPSQHRRVPARVCHCQE